ALSAALFRPVRNTTQHLVDRYIYGLRFDLNELQQAQRPKTVTNPGKLTGLHFGDYEILGVLGKGGMGEVYEGYGNNQRVAIKTLLPDTATKEDSLIRFQREAETGRKLDHPTIARVFDSGSYEGTPYIIMEYLDGQDLGDRLKQDGKLDIETTLAIAQDVCTALLLAHEAGYVHRDLKPSNIMIRENGSAGLMDFGISKVQDDHSITGTDAIGTIHYMAPEQIIASREVDPRADIYALGVLLYEMLTGVKPFKGTPAQILFGHLQQPAPDVRMANPEIPRHIAKAINKAMSKHPDDRFQMVGEFAEALLSP
ncbi:MAG: serine/threonine protein kinase, partial [Anaerolineae bacterium]|nr:serine/threonine protein kinase [Anaerolineae bacterium]